MAMKTKTECRVCLKDGGSIPIFGDDDKPDISLEVAIFGSIQLDIEDEFPKALCKACFKLLDNAISFRKSALHADVVLQRRRQKGLSKLSSTVKLESSNEDNTTAANVPKPDFLIVTTTENAIEIKDEYLSDEILLDDGGSCFDVDDSKINVLNCNKKEENIERCDYECTVCSQSFSTLEEHEWHQQSLAHIKNCSIGIKAKIKLEQGPTKDQKCNECDKLFTVNQYKKHMKVVHKVREERPTKTKECPVCKKLFRPDYLARHKRAVHGMDVQKSDEPPKLSVECPVCKKTLVRRYFNTHMKMHDKSSNKKFICDVCGKNFTFQSAFINHRAIHNNDLPYKCDYCPYRGRSKHLLRIHTRTHTGDYPYKCTQCSARCITKSNLNRHMLRHKGPVDFLCDSCNRSFYSKLELERHITVIHLGIKSHICNICGVAFGYRQGLMKHQRKVHKRAKGLGRAKATYLKLQEEEILQQEAGGVE
ncbi:hypothetical protein O0L34_g14546 [Tuta absoluta]|nr:hypothetical protein O0L34_g14546 [Tuta absoluta]